MLSTTVTIVIKIIVNNHLLTVEPLLWDTSIQGWDFHFGNTKFGSGKNGHITFASVTSIKGTVTPLFRGNWDTHSGSQNPGLTSIGSMYCTCGISTQNFAEI